MHAHSQARAHTHTIYEHTIVLQTHPPRHTHTYAHSCARCALRYLSSTRQADIRHTSKMPAVAIDCAAHLPSATSNMPLIMPHSNSAHTQNLHVHAHTRMHTNTQADPLSEARNSALRRRPRYTLAATPVAAPAAAAAVGAGASCVVAGAGPAAPLSCLSACWARRMKGSGAYSQRTDRPMYLVCVCGGGVEGAAAGRQQGGSNAGG